MLLQLLLVLLMIIMATTSVMMMMMSAHTVRQDKSLWRKPYTLFVNSINVPLYRFMFTFSIHKALLWWLVAGAEHNVNFQFFTYAKVLDSILYFAKWLKFLMFPQHTLSYSYRPYVFRNLLWNVGIAWLFLLFSMFSNEFSAFHCCGYFFVCVCDEQVT